MRFGILADIHANVDALQAVLDDGGDGIDAWCCLGDVLGRGPFPIETLELLRRIAPRVWLVGNHDAYVIGLLRSPDENDYDPPVWEDHRRQIMAHEAARGRWGLWRWCRQTWQAARAEPRQITTPAADCWLVHGALGSCQHNIGDVAKYSYIMPGNDSENQSIREWQFNELRSRQRDGRSVVLIHGHTHIPYATFRSWDLDRDVLLPIRYDRPQTLADYDALLICPGSVGQPRNGDAIVPVHAAYGILDTRASTFEFRRVPYNSERTQLEMMRRGYATVLVEALKGNHLGARERNSNFHWLNWQQIYRPQPWGWEPIISKTLFIAGGLYD